MGGTDLGSEEGRLSPERLGLIYDRLDDLAGALEQAGFHIAAELKVDARRLLLDMAVRGELPDSLPALARYLGPVFSRTPAEQDRFPSILASWAAGLEAYEVPVESTDFPSRSDEPLPHQEARPGGLRRLLNVLSQLGWSGLVVVAVAIAIVVLLWSATNGLDLAGAFRPAATTAQPGTAIEPVISVPRAPLLWAAFALAVGVPLGTWLIKRRRHTPQWSDFELRAETLSAPELRKLIVGPGGRADHLEPFDSPEIAVAERSLARRVPVGTGGIDIEATIARMAVRPGEYVMVAATRMASPDHLVLVDRFASGDHRARLVDALVGRLEARGVSFQVYNFEADPRVCVPRDNPAALISLDDLAMRAPAGQRLLIWSDGAGLIDPRNGEPELWVANLHTWPERVLMTPEPTSLWGYREAALRRDGLKVVPATPLGLAAFGLSVDPSTGPPPRTAPGLARPLPSLLTDDIRRWTGRREPGVSATRALLKALRDDLGETGFLWLGACAVFPTLQWELTVALGRALRRSDGESLYDEVALIRLSRLPWFVRGAMPAWLRHALLKSIPPDFEADARACVDELLQPAIAADAQEFSIDVAVGERPQTVPGEPRIVPALAASPRPTRLGVPVSRELVYLLTGGQERASAPDRLDDLSDRARQVANGLFWAGVIWPLLGLPVVNYSPGRSDYYSRYVPFTFLLGSAVTGWWSGARRSLFAALPLMFYLIVIDSIGSLTILTWFAVVLGALVLSVTSNWALGPTEPPDIGAKIRVGVRWITFIATLYEFVIFLIVTTSTNHYITEYSDHMIFLIITASFDAQVLTTVLGLAIGEKRTSSVAALTVILVGAFWEFDFVDLRRNWAWFPFFVLLSVAAVPVRRSASTRLDLAARLSVASFAFAAATAVTCLIALVNESIKYMNILENSPFFFMNLATCLATGSIAVGYCVRRLNPLRLGLYVWTGFIVGPLLMPGSPTGSTTGTIFWAIHTAVTGMLAVFAWYEPAGEWALTRPEQWLFVVPVRALAAAAGLGAGTVLTGARSIRNLQAGELFRPLRIYARLYMARRGASYRGYPVLRFIIYDNPRQRVFVDALASRLRAKGVGYERAGEMVLDSLFLSMIVFLSRAKVKFIVPLSLPDYVTRYTIQKRLVDLGTRRHTKLLISVPIDGYDENLTKNQDSHGIDADDLELVDFRGWSDPLVFDQAFERLLLALDATTAAPAKAAGFGFLVPVWYCTNRKPVDLGNIARAFSSASDDRLHYGACEVSIPTNHRFGSVGSSMIRRLITGKDDRLKIATIRPVTGEEFRDRVKADVASKSPLDSAPMVFIHSYNSTFQDTALRAAQIGYDLKLSGSTVLFSWPSRGRLADYAADGTALEASSVRISEFLQSLIAGPSRTRVHILAHGMGCRGLLAAMNRLAVTVDVGIPFGQIILVAADVDSAVFRDISNVLIRLAERVTLYVSSTDRALELSARLHGNPRAGYASPVTVVPGIDTIDVTGLNLTLVGHGYFADASPVLSDIRSLCADGLPPERRFGLRHVETQAGEAYWKLSR